MSRSYCNLPWCSATNSGRKHPADSRSSSLKCGVLLNWNDRTALIWQGID